MTEELDGIDCEADCPGCGKFSFRVRWRNAVTENVVEWLEGAVKPAMGYAHWRHDPTCTSPHADLKIPVPDGTKAIGSRITN